MRNYRTKHRLRKVLVLVDGELSFNYAPGSRGYYLARELTESRFSVTLAGWASKRASITSDIFETLLFQPPTDAGILQTLFRFVLPFRVVMKLGIRHWSAIIIRGYWMGLILFTLTRLLRLNIKLVYDFHGYVYREQQREGRALRTLTTKLMERYCLRAADRILTQSQGRIALIPSEYRHKALLLPNAVDLEPFYRRDKAKEREIRKRFGLKETDTILLAVGNWGIRNDLETVIEATRLLAPDVKVILAGKIGPIHQSTIKATRQPENLITTGLLDHMDVVALMTIADVCLAPYAEADQSSQEPGAWSSRKVLEYLAAGKPILMPDVPGREPFLVEGENVILYQPRQPGNLVREAHSLVEDRTEFDTIGCNNRKLAEDFSWKQVFDRSKLSVFLTAS
jgi:glycosyltransferase involved in cell wall biosynthesis